MRRSRTTTVRVFSPVGIAMLACGLTAPAFAQTNESATLLAEADRLAWLTNWSAARPVYAAAERAALRAGDRRAATHARFGRLRGEMQGRPLGALADELATELSRPLVANDARLRLRGLVAKGDVDLEWDVLAALRDWRQIREVARELGDAAWENRANGELGMIAFLRGNTGEASKAVQQAMETARALGDVGGELRYLGAIGNGLLLAGYLQMAMGFVDRALALARAHPDTGFPFVATSTKVLALLELKQFGEAERFAQAALTVAQTGDRRIKEIELRIMLARIAEAQRQPTRAIEHLETARSLALEGQVIRLLPDAEASLAQAYRRAGDLPRAASRAASAVTHTRVAGARFMLPLRLGELATLRAAQGRPSAAAALYSEAGDVVEAIMANAPSRAAQARLVSVMSDLYTGHFRLAAEQMANPHEAFRVIERARGRALVDVLRTLPSEQSSPEEEARSKAIAALQLRLMAARSARQRQRLLEQVWEAERRASIPASRLVAPRERLPETGAAAVALVQQALQPGELLLEYLLLPDASYCLVLTKRALRLERLADKASLDKLATTYRQALQRGQADATSTAARALFTAIVAPLRIDGAQARNVVVVPDGQLHTIAFEPLLEAGGWRPTSVSLAPSATTLALLRRSGAPRSTERTVLALGGVPYGDMPEGPRAAQLAPIGFFDATPPNRLPALPGTADEARGVATALGGHSTVLVGQAATEARLKAEPLHQYQVLHLAAHGVADDKFPERTAVVLLGDAASGEDGLLQTREITGFRLRARLVVLSACDTAVGPLLGQEGVVNLARAFLVAGAGAVMTTLWPVADSQSAGLMRGFYGRLARGQALGEALHGAKADLVAQFGGAASSTVAAFQLSGDSQQRLTLAAATAKPSGAVVTLKRP